MLEEYGRKRDFSKTPEPGKRAERRLKKEGVARKRAAGGARPLLFVIQKHDATRIHYDFRLEHKGVLKSWAVPKGVSDDPSDRRLAIMVEDHPLSYAGFEGEIPEGEYGAGRVEIWDKGKYINITVVDGRVMPLDRAIEKGHFKVYLKGGKVEGGYSFIRVPGRGGARSGQRNKDNWIVVKMKEATKVPAEVKVRGRVIRITNPDKELDDGLTKADMIRYYENIASLMLPHIKGRLISMYRFPDGVRGKQFFQKQAPDYFPDWLECVPVKHKSKSTCYTVVRDEAGIVYLANQVIVPHIMATRRDKLDRPDKMIFDFDPSSTDLKKLKAAVKRLKGMLEQLGMRPYIMSTGGRGYHVAVPIKRELDNEAVRDFALKIAGALLAQDRSLTTEIRKEKRKGRIFIDVNRISSMQTSVAPYAVRAAPGLTVASPFDWDELPNIDPATYSVKNYPKDDAWKDFFKNTVSLKGVMKRVADL